MKLAILSGILFIAVVGLVCERKAYQAQIAELERPVTIEGQIKAIQQQVGAKVDGIIGYETMGLANAKVKEERREQHNQYALVFFDPNFYAKGLLRGTDAPYSLKNQ